MTIDWNYPPRRRGLPGQRDRFIGPGAALAALLILQAPLYLRHPVAMLAVCVAILFNSYLLPPTPGLAWFAPFFSLKLLVSHLPGEEPYRQET